ncbi:DUF3015 family protein [Psychrobacter aestuarii]|uniref:DUF3015 domain-containing protein n=1 Tax=Psychrobacter aestuarii TaxID=556327 RepID=A0ABN0W3B2_9GAMM|nr:DUF3015 family protein [Psychrobacter aestuarii]
MIKKLAIATVCAAMMPLTAANADLGSNFKTADTGRSIEQIYKECGIGGALFGKSSPILAIISNVTWDLGTTAATSDSMSPETCQGGNVRAAVLIKEAFPSVEKDLAAGQGAHLSALQNVAGCYSVANIRKEYGAYAQTSAYRNATQDQNAEALYSIVSNSCAI